MNQEEYDLLLVESFYIRPDYPMWRICGHHNSDVVGLRRKPDDNCLGMSVCVFICSYLPGIANVLWKRNKKDAQKIARAVSKSPIDTRETNAYKSVNARTERKSKTEIRNYKKIMKLAVEISTVNRRCTGHDWRTVK
jgi:hypothetical protein